MSDNTQHQRGAGTDVQRSISETAELFSLLGNQRRIHVLTEIHQREDEAFSVDTLVDGVASREFGGGFGAEQRKSVFIALYQCHLPQLDAASVISYDQNAAQVRRGPNFEESMVALDGVLRADYCV